MDCSPTRIFCLGDFPGKNTRVGCHFLLQGIFPIQGSNWRRLHWHRFFTAEPLGSLLFNFQIKKKKKGKQTVSLTKWKTYHKSLYALNMAWNYTANPKSTNEVEIINMHACSVTQSCSTLCDPVACSPARLLHPWESPVKNTGEGCHACLQGIFPTQR